ncbi:MAG: glutamine synthetase catalytic domain protein [Thermomicrobiales bacterium]|jgi:glutamine synthetase|nr:glutamine synthetase catalytic domain protein [Thermomicrobiales bacterium]MDF3037709.1 glutamine synthetase catalytic domain protein [Thermomicrobiales bacterium]
MLAIDDLERAGYHTVAIASPDTQGRPVGRTLPLSRFLDDPAAGVDISSYALVYDLAGIPLEDSPFAGAHTGYHDIGLRPDLTTLRPYPGVPGTAICIADVVDAGGNEVSIAPRAMLRRQTELANSAGYEPLMAMELEFYLFHDDLRDARRRGYRDLEPTTPARSTYGIAAAIAQHPFLFTVSEAMTAAGIPVGSAQTEAGRGQWEVNLPHTDPLTAADHHLLFKLGVKELARQAGHSASFMARPVPDDLGSSCHIHCSLLCHGAPAFPAEPGSGCLAPVGQHFLGGLLAHLTETAIFFAPNANSYKRHAPGFAAGGVIAWGMDNRSVAIRVAGHGGSLRLEHRYPGADANPYLAATAILAAGLEGITTTRNPGPPIAGDADAHRDLSRSPASLGAALAAFEESSFVREALGPDTVAHYAAHARAEWTAFLAAVTDWEITRAFEAV